MHDASIPLSPPNEQRERKGSSLNLRCNNPFENRLRLRWPFAAVRPSQWPSTTATQNPPLPFVSDAIGPPPFSKGEEVHFKWRLPFRLEKDITTVLICTFVLETFFLLHEVPANVWWLCSFPFICFGKKKKQKWIVGRTFFLVAMRAAGGFSFSLVMNGLGEAKISEGVRVKTKGKLSFPEEISTSSFTLSKFQVAKQLS